MAETEVVSHENLDEKLADMEVKIGEPAPPPPPADPDAEEEPSVTDVAVEEKEEGLKEAAAFEESLIISRRVRSSHHI